MDVFCRQAGSIDESHADCGSQGRSTLAGAEEADDASVHDDGLVVVAQGFWIIQFASSTKE